jgi:hypothetical protein
MKNLRLFLASLALTCCGFFPAAAMADDMDELDVTMEVLDDVAGIDGNVMIMRGPESGAAEGPDGEDSDHEGGFEDEMHAGEDGHQGESDEGINDDDLRAEEEREHEEESDDGFEADSDFLGEDDDEDELVHNEGDFDDGESIDDDEIEDDDDDMDDDDMDDDDDVAELDDDVSDDVDA